MGLQTSRLSCRFGHQRQTLFFLQNDYPESILNMEFPCPIAS